VGAELVEFPPPVGLGLGVEVVVPAEVLAKDTDEPPSEELQPQRALNPIADTAKRGARVVVRTEKERRNIVIKSPQKTKNLILNR
jgi:hypothetical protein